MDTIPYKTFSRVTGGTVARTNRKSSAFRGLQPCTLQIDGVGIEITFEVGVCFWGNLSKHRICGMRAIDEFPVTAYNNTMSPMTRLNFKS